MYACTVISAVFCANWAAVTFCFGKSQYEYSEDVLETLRYQ